MTYDNRNIKISDFSYDLPDDRIARYPLPERDQSRLLLWNKGEISSDTFSRIPEYLPENSMLVFNNTRVIHARLFFRKETGSKIEIFCLEPVIPSDYQIAFQQTGEVTWKCMVGNAKKWKDEILNRKITVDGEEVELTAQKEARNDNTFHIKLNWNRPVTFSEIIEEAGTLPIPPYLNRETEPLDEVTYQTVYAKLDGSVAAPTAGLHFTKTVLEKLSAKGIAQREITLHVGAGTFQPVKSDTISGHNMHHEKVIIPRSFIEELLETGRNIIAVGTTSVRSLESIYWLGAGLKPTDSPADLEVKQWKPYENKNLFPLNLALENILNYLEAHHLTALQFSTQLIILPGYEFKIVQGMITNFHQPQSTLLLLISAFLGDDWKRVYDFALQNGFRFLSYGDSNLYLK